MIVALGMLDGPVSHDHGGPVRMYVDGQYGYKSTKWLSGIELTEDEVPGYWEHRGYDIDGTIREWVRRHWRGSPRPSGGCTGPPVC